MYCLCSHVLTLEEVGGQGAQADDHNDENQPAEQQVQSSCYLSIRLILRWEERPLVAPGVSAQCVTMQADRGARGSHAPAYREKRADELHEGAIDLEQHPGEDHLGDQDNGDETHSPVVIGGEG